MFAKAVGVLLFFGLIVSPIMSERLPISALNPGHTRIDWNQFIGEVVENCQWLMARQDVQSVIRELTLSNACPSPTNWTETFGQRAYWQRLGFPYGQIDAAARRTHDCARAEGFPILP